MENPSISLIPSAYKTSKVYSQLPNGGNGDFTFTRGSIATKVNSDGLIETAGANIPRIDYFKSNCPSLLLEPAGTNLQIRSEEFDNSHYSKSRITVSANQVVSPDGLMTADQIIETTDTGTHDLFKFNFIAVSAVSHTFSIFAKQSGDRNLQITSQSGANFVAKFDIENGIVLSNTGDSARIEDYGDGWFRCSVTGVPAVGNMGFLIDPLIGTTSSYTGDGKSGLFLWGFQIEATNDVTSYIKTISTTVTRAADKLTNSGNTGLFNSFEGVLYGEIAASAELGSERIIAIDDGTLNNRLYIEYHTTLNAIRGVVIVGGVAQKIFTHIPTTILDFHKVALKYKLNDLSFWVDGVEVGIEATSLVYPGDTLTNLKFGLTAGGFDFYGKCKELKVYKTALTDAELTVLTS